MSADIKQVFEAKLKKDFTFLEFYKRYNTLTLPCHRLIYELVLKYWTVVTDLITAIHITQDLVTDDLYAFFTEEYLKNFTSMNWPEDAPITFLEFFITFTSGFRKMVASYVKQNLPSNSLTTLEFCLEVANIRYLELSGMRFTCQVFNCSPSDCSFMDSHLSISDPHLLIKLVPEYFIDPELVFSSMYSAVATYLPPDLPVVYDTSNLSDDTDLTPFIKVFSDRASPRKS